MIKIDQTKVVVKNSQGKEVVRGNCYAACIASIMELPITEVPNVETLFHIEGSFWQDVMLSFIASKGWDLCCDDRFKCFHVELLEGKPENNSEWLERMRRCLKDKHYLVSGKSPRGVTHITIWQNGNMVHDPHPTKEGILTFDTFQTLEKINR